MKGISLLGGPLELIPEGFLSELEYNNKFLSDVDRDNLFLVEKGLTPDVAVGDFDSLKKVELARIEKVVKSIRYSNPVRDLTDSELMVRTAFENYHLTSLKVYGVAGSGLDHFLANLSTFLKPEFQIYAPKAALVDRRNVIGLFLPGKHHIRPLEGCSYLGIINLTEVKNLSVRGAEYPLENYTSAYPVFFAFNEFIADKSIKLHFEKGAIAVIYSRDLNRFTNL